MFPWMFASPIFFNKLSLSQIHQRLCVHSDKTRWVPCRVLVSFQKLVQVREFLLNQFAGTIGAILMIIIFGGFSTIRTVSLNLWNLAPKKKGPVISKTSTPSLVLFYSVLNLHRLLLFFHPSSSLVMIPIVSCTIAFLRYEQPELRVSFLSGLQIVRSKICEVMLFKLLTRCWIFENFGERFSTRSLL